MIFRLSAEEINTKFDVVANFQKVIFLNHFKFKYIDDKKMTDF